MSLPANFPTSLDALANPTATTNRNDSGFELHAVVSRIHDILEALEAKVGIGASLPSAAGVLRETAPGVTGWGQVAAGDYSSGSIAAADIAAGATMKRIGQATPSGVNSVTFSSIPNSYAALRLTGLVRSAVVATTDTVIVRVGASSVDSGSNYDSQALAGSGSSVVAFDAYAQSYATLGAATGASAPSGRFALFDVMLPNYTNASANKELVSTYHATWGTSANLQQGGVYGATWRSTTAIDIISIYFLGSANFVAGSVITLWGLP